MKLLAMSLVAVALTLCGGCQPSSPTAPTPTRTVSATATATAIDAVTPDRPLDEPPAPTPPEKPGADAEPLPEPPKADPANTHKPLTPGSALLLEVKPDPADAKKTKPVRLLLQTEVCLRQGVLEVLLCKTDTKEHEAILRTAVDARLVHGGLLALGLAPGSPVQFVDPKTGDAKYVAASGAGVKVAVHYRRAGRLYTHPAQEWIRDVRSKKPMAHGWVFGGSRFLKNPDEPGKAPFYTANNGEVIGISNFIDSMLDLPVAVTGDDTELNFEAVTGLVPALRSKVWVILEGAPAVKP